MIQYGWAAPISGNNINTIMEYINDNEEGRKLVRYYQSIFPGEKWRKVKIEVEDGNWLDGDDHPKDDSKTINGFKIVREYRELHKEEFYIYTMPGDKEFGSLKKFNMEPNNWDKGLTLDYVKSLGQEGSRYYKIIIEEQA